MQNSAHCEILTEKQTVLKKQNFKAIALTFWAICQGKLFVEMNHIVIKAFSTVLLRKN